MALPRKLKDVLERMEYDLENLDKTINASKSLPSGDTWFFCPEIETLDGTPILNWLVRGSRYGLKIDILSENWGDLKLMVKRNKDIAKFLVAAHNNVDYLKDLRQTYADLVEALRSLDRAKRKKKKIAGVKKGKV